MPLRRSPVRKPESFSGLRLSTRRLELRPLTQDDAPQLFAIFSDREVMRYWSSVPWPSMDFARAFIERDQAAMASGEWLRLGVVRVEGGVLLGMCTLFSFMETCSRCELGYGFARHAWGLGYMQESVGRLLQYGFDELQLHRIEADTDPRNTASGRGLERLGFRREGLMRERWIVGDEISDTAFYGLIRSDWQAARASR